MHLLLIRHAIAQDRDVFARTGAADFDRPLTDVGRRRMRAVTTGLQRLVPAIDLLAASPLVRTVETARIVSATYGSVPLLVESLAPDKPPSAFLAWLRAQDAESTIAAVGHDPGLPRIVGLLAGGKGAPIIAIKKGGACFLRMEDVPRAGSAVLLWALAPAHLRDLGR
ncbi:MAG: histidine phosphatase family protein [Anaerolineae bacterium]|nr:histidine phosphatase family protein [Gemmatimonadaceae bacterium]